MRLVGNLFVILFCYFLCTTLAKKKSDDDDFAEFDEFDQDEFVIETPSTTNSPPSGSANKPDSVKHDDHSTQTDSGKSKDDEVTINDEDDDEAMFDDEEFESSEPFSSATASPHLEIAEVPASLTYNRWEAYQCEAVMLIVLLGYLINFLIGRTKNARLALTLHNSQRDLLERNFSLIGDSGQTQNASSEESTESAMQKLSDNLYILWCSGHRSSDSMLIELRLLKRQCVFNSVAALIKSINDTIVYTVDFSKDELETFVFCLARKRSAIKLHRDMNDLSQFCTERKNAEKRGIGANYQILSEIGEVANTIIDSRVVEFVDKFPDALEYIHISDQYTGTKAVNGEPSSSSSSSSTSGSNTGTATQQQDALNTSERSVRRVLIVAFNLLAQDGRSLQVTGEVVGTDYLRLVLHLIERVSSYRLPSKDSKSKAIKNRQRIEEQFMKSVNLQRQEQAQIRREEQRRAEKEKIMQSDDPELQRKWEEKEHKREMKKRQPKMKQMKVKAM